ncbi:MAG TPA: hypothetical protein VF847_01335 [Candidatus Deferrimicrobiaceae bacterium]
MKTTGRILKGVVTFFLYLSIYTYLALGGIGIALQAVSPASIASMPAWHSAAFGAVSVACINGICYFGNRLDRIHAADERDHQARAELMEAWRR